MAVCRSCNADIEWARTEGGKPIPLDPGHVDGGNLTVLSGVARKRTSEDVRLRRPARRAHFATCPHAAEHRASR